MCKLYFLVRFVCKTAKTFALLRSDISRCYSSQVPPQMVRRISHCCGNPVICGDTHHYIHRLSSVFVLDSHGVSARVLQSNAFDGQTGKPALVQRHHVLEQQRSDVSEVLHSHSSNLLLCYCEAPLIKNTTLLPSLDICICIL